MFAAYAHLSTESTDAANEHKNDQEKPEWLFNSSYKTVTDATSEETPHSSKREHDLSSSSAGHEIDEDHHRKSKKKRKKRKHKKPKFEDKVDVNIDSASECFYVDTSRTPEYLSHSVLTIARPSVPKYDVVYYYTIGRWKSKKKKKFKRYFKAVQTDVEENITEKDVKNKSNDQTFDENFKGFQEEEDISKLTGIYSKSVTEDPHNVETWIKYINLQDHVFQFEKQYKKGSIAKGIRVMAERKLSIIEKALSHNPTNEKLNRMRIYIASSVYPADELQKYLGKLVEKEPENIILWQGFIEATQCSMSHCNTTSVISLYNKCLHTLHTLRRTLNLDKEQLEENILRILYQCGLFLKQAGLFEQLWTLLRLYLDLNLSPPTEKRFSLTGFCDESQLQCMEDTVLESQLPIHELWLRVEQLREARHWLPVTDPDCSDPQRIVFPEDVADLIHPITMPNNLMKLSVTILNLLKIPLLPSRHTTMKYFGIDYVHWSLDSIEYLMPIFYPQYNVDVSISVLEMLSMKLAVSPQYLRTFPGQEEYLEFILTVMRNIMNCFPDENDKTAMAVWWFRFQILLATMEKYNCIKIPTALKSKIKTQMKEMLKENKGNLLMFMEFAKYEFETGNTNKAITVLTTALKMTTSNVFVLNIADVNTKAAILSIFRLYIEIKLSTKQNFQDLFNTLLMGNEFDTFTNKVWTDPPNNNEHFLPDYAVEWIILHFYYLYSTIDFASALELVEGKVMYSNSLRDEALIEFYIAKLFEHCTQISGSRYFSKLDTCLYKAIETYPDNVFLLSILCKLQTLHSNLGQPWWKFQSLLLKTRQSLAGIFSVIIIYQKMLVMESGWRDTITGNSLSHIGGFKIKLSSLFKRLTANDMCTRRCGLIWRLYLQFLHKYFDAKTCRNTYYTAVEECPWLKALYIDAAIYIPEELAQIQDLIIEKQLRIHVTPDELDVLRS